MRMRDGMVLPSYWAKSRRGIVHLFLADWSDEAERYGPAVCGFDGARLIVNPVEPDRQRDGLLGPRYHPTPVDLLCETCRQRYEDATGNDDQPRLHRPGLHRHLGRLPGLGQALRRSSHPLSVRLGRGVVQWPRRQPEAVGEGYGWARDRRVVAAAETSGGLG